MKNAKKMNPVVHDDDSYDLTNAVVVRVGPKNGRPYRHTLRGTRAGYGKGKTQVELAAAAGMKQGDVSRLEGYTTFDTCLVSTLRRYVEALGGELSLVVSFPTGHRLEIVPAEKK
jgi:hypothetical protein